ncbi:MAG: hypothetical protein ACE5OY_06565 [Candidatus Bathyarchaeia archaeon]
MNIYLIGIGFLFLLGGLLRALVPHRFVRFYTQVRFLPLREWLVRNERLVRPAGAARLIIGVLCIYFGL